MPWLPMPTLVPNMLRKAGEVQPSSKTSSTSSARARPRPPYSSGIDRPNRPIPANSPRISSGMRSSSATCCSSGTNRSRTKRRSTCRVCSRVSVSMVVFFTLPQGSAARLAQPPRPEKPAASVLAQQHRRQPASQHGSQHGDETVGRRFLAREVVYFLLNALLVDEQRARLRGDDPLVADQVDLGLVGADRRGGRKADRGAEQLGAEEIDAADALVIQQIGRESCRERVCQYV